MTRIGMGLVGQGRAGPIHLGPSGKLKNPVGFEPASFRPRFRNGHLQTLYAWARPRRFPQLPAPESRYFDVAADACVLAHCHWHERRQEHPTLMLLHGLEGSSLAHYMCGIADKAWTAGWNIVRLNQRNCGGTEHLSRGLYHSGLTADPLSVMRELIEVDRLPEIAIAGYSLGGNLALKLAGELGDTHPPELKAVCAVSPTMELAICVQALERASNVAYQWNFMRNLRGRMRRKAAAFPDVYDLAPLPNLWTVRQFDEAYTAPHHGFQGASDYYHRASAMRVIHGVRVPTLVMTAEDDPFVPVQPFTERAVTDNTAITVTMTSHGGHCAFVEHEDAGYDGYWAEREIVRFCDVIATRSRAAASAASRTPAPSLLPRA
jgi:uncharacterized protein